MNKAVVSILLVFVFFYSGSGGCEKALQNIPGTVSFSTIQRGDQSGIQSRQQRVIRTKHEYDQMMNQLGSVYSPAPVYPDVDFNTYMVIAVFMGMQTSGGFETRIEEIGETSAGIQVIAREISPGINCMVTDVITYPYHIVRLRKINKTVKYTFVPDVKLCN
jgi:hypothetical protein